jgi:hypothetical protein
MNTTISTAQKVFMPAQKSLLAYPENILVCDNPRLKRARVITTSEQLELFDSILKIEISNFFANWHSSNCLEQHWNRLYDRLAIEQANTHKSFEACMAANRTVVALFQDLSTFEGRLKFCSKYLVSFELDLQDIKISESVLRAIFSEYIKNSIKYAVTGTNVEITSNLSGVFMVNRHKYKNIFYHFMDKDRKRIGLLLLKKFAKRIKGKFEHSNALDSTIYKTEFRL